MVSSSIVSGERSLFSGECRFGAGLAFLIANNIMGSIFIRLVVLLLSLAPVGCGMRFHPSAGEVDEVRLDGRLSNSQPVTVTASDASGDPNGSCDLIGPKVRDERTGVEFSVRTRFAGPCAELALDRHAEQRLLAAAPDGTAPRLIANLTGFGDLRLVFVRDRVLLLARRSGRQHLFLYDAQTLAEVARHQTTAEYGGARVSPSGRFVLFADESAFDWANLGWPLHVFDTVTGEIRVLDSDGRFADARWTHQSDRLLAVTQTLRYSNTAETRVLLWSLARGWPAGRGWPEPLIDVRVPQASTDLWFTFDWITVSPDDRRAVIPVHQTANGETDPRLLVLDLETGRYESARGVQGPAVFTRGGEGILAFRETGDGWSLLDLDARTLAAAALALPHPPRRSFQSPFELASANTVVIRAWRATMFYDIAAGRVSTNPGALARLVAF